MFDHNIMQHKQQNVTFSRETPSHLKLKFTQVIVAIINPIDTLFLYPPFGRGTVGLEDVVGEFVGEADGAVSHSCSDTEIS